MIEHFSRGSSSADILDVLERDGAVVVDEFLDAARVEGLVSDLQPHLDAVPWCNTGANDVDEFFGLQTKRLHGLVGRSKLVGELTVEPLLLEMCDRFLAPNARDYRLSTGELMALGFGETEQALHRDADSWYHFPPPRPDLLVSANIALTDFTEENGATVVVPGSHKWPRERKPEESEKGQAPMSPGSVLLYSGDVMHAGGANRTGEVRIGLYLGYILSWLRPIENHCITSGIEAIRSTPPRAQRLLDYTEDGWTVIA